MNWNKDKSLKFTRVCIYFFAVLLVGICVGAPWLYRGFFRTSQSSFRRNATVLFSDELCYGSSCWSGALQNEWSVEKYQCKSGVHF